MLAILKPLVVIALVAFFFGPMLLRLWRSLNGKNATGGARTRSESRRDLPPNEPTVGAYCPHCGAQIPSNARYCSQCGRDVSCVDV